MQTLHKKEVTWCGALSDYKSRIRFNPESIQGAVGMEMSYVFTDSNGNPNLFNVNRNGNEPWLNTNNGRPDNFYNSNNRFAFVPAILFILPLDYFRAEVSFLILFRQPPSIRPISLSNLGWVTFYDHRTLRTSTKRRMFRRIAENLKSESISSYLGLLSHGNSYKLRKKIANISNIC